jgi:hypothetical protein
MKRIKKRVLFPLLSIPVILGLLYAGLHVYTAVRFPDLYRNRNNMKVDAEHHYEHKKTMWDYNEQTAFLFELSDKFTVSEIGTINYRHYPEYTMYKASYGEANSARSYLFICGMHGIEVSPNFAMKEFMLYLDSIKLLENISIDFLYMVNPYGFEYQCYYSVPNIQLNYDFVKFRMQEARYIRDSTKGKKYTGVYDFHEHDEPGFLMLCYTRKSRELANNVSELLRSNDMRLNNNYAERLFAIIYKAENGVFYEPLYYTRFFEHFLKIKSAEEYFAQTAEAEYVILFETPFDELLMWEKIDAQLMVMKYLVGL